MSSISYYKWYATVVRDWELKDVYHTLLYFRREGNGAPEICKRLLCWETWQSCIWSCIIRWPGVFGLFNPYGIEVCWGFGLDTVSHWSWGMGAALAAYRLHRVCELQTGHSARKPLSSNMSMFFGLCYNVRKFDAYNLFSYFCLGSHLHGYKRQGAAIILASKLCHDNCM